MTLLTKTLSFLAILAHLGLASGVDTAPKEECTKAFEACDWTFLGISSVPTFDIDGASNQPISPPIISKDPAIQLGVLNTNGVAPEFIFETGTFPPITLFADPPLTVTHFKPLFISGTYSSGVGFQTFDPNGDQLEVAKGKCVRLFFTSYQKFVGPPVYVQNLNVGRSANKCVVFKTASMQA